MAWAFAVTAMVLFLTTIAQALLDGLSGDTSLRLLLLLCLTAFSLVLAIATWL